MRAIEWGGQPGAGEAALPLAASRAGTQARALVVGLVLAVFAALGLTGVPSSVLSTGPQSSHRRPLSRSTIRLPETLAGAASVSLGASEHAFWAVRDGGSLLAVGGGIDGVFSASGARLRVGPDTLSLSNPVLERGGLARRLTTSAPVAVRNEIVYRHGPLTELYRNGPYGLEQAFVLTRRPFGGREPLVVAMRLGGSLIPKLVGSQILLGTPNGATTLRYGQLSVRDAVGRVLPARLQLHRGMLALRIADRAARYPLRIDPFVQQGAKLTAGGEETGAAQFGKEVTLSSDGNTALIGAPNDNGGIGAAWVFTRSGTTWTQQGSKLNGAGETGTGLFGSSVALSADGNTALIGGSGDSKEAGAVWVFTRSGTAWTQQAAKLIGTEALGKAQFGFRVALSADGNTALIGGPGDHAFHGAAWVFTRSGETWTQQVKLTGSGATLEAEFGLGVALSGDGNTALIGGSGDATFTGAAWVFVRAAETWTQQGSKLTGSGEEGSGRFGFHVALSETGDTALIGAGSDASESGAAFVFLRSGTTWAQQARLKGGGEVGKGHFGYSVSLAADGNTALVGAVADDAEVGAAWVFARTGSTWEQQGSKLTGSEASGKRLFGSSAALSSDAGTAMVGGSNDSSAIGAAWAFGAAAPELPTVTTKPASSLTTSSAVLNATVNPNGGTVTDCHFEYGVSISYTSSVPCSKPPGAGSNPVAVSAQVTGLSRNQSYHFRIVATNGGGTGEGADQLFTTRNPPEFGRCVKVPLGVKGQYTTSKCTSPATPEKFAYNWEPGPGPKPQFTMKIKATTVATLEMTGAKKVLCTGQTGGGEYSGPSTVAGVTLTFTGCELEGAKCNSAAAAEGEVASAPLEGAIGIEKASLEGPLKDKVAMDLLPVGGLGPMMEFSCGLAVVSVRGSVLVPVKTNAMLIAATLSYTSAADKQKPEQFEGQPVDVLETSLNEGPYARAGLKLTTILTNQEKIEINTVA